jgi:hypothetical protein
MIFYDSVVSLTDNCEKMRHLKIGDGIIVAL